MTAQDAFGIVAMFYAVANLASMGLELNLRQTITSLRSARVLGLTLGWSWIVGPAFAVLLTKLLPMAEPYAVGLLIFSLAPTAPALPLFIRIARADMSLAAAIMPLAVVGTVVLMPVLVPWLIPGLTVSSWAIAKPLILTVLMPLVVGVAIKVYAPRVADSVFPAMKKIAGISTLLLLGFVVFLHWRELLSALGSYGIAGQVLFILGMALVSYTFGFGLNEAQRSTMALAICTRNGSAMLVAITAFPNLDPNLMAMILLAVPVPLAVWLVVSRVLGSRAGTPEGQIDHDGEPGSVSATLVRGGNRMNRSAP
jgi:BASS family bile acid:Na+ symporter